MYETGQPPSEFGEDDEYADDTEGTGEEAGSRIGNDQYAPDAYAFETYEQVSQYDPHRSGTWYYEGESQVRQEPNPEHYSPFDDGIYSDDGRSNTIGGVGGGGGRCDDVKDLE